MNKITITGIIYFNSQPHEEADAQGVPGTPGANDFNSQPHEEADHCNRRVGRY